MPSVLIVKPSSLGDIVHSLPCVYELKKSIKDVKISWLCESSLVSVLENNDFIDKVIEFPRNDFRGIFSFIKFFRWLRNVRVENRFDYVLDFQGLFRSALIGRFLCKGFGDVNSDGKRERGQLIGLKPSREFSHIFYDKVFSYKSNFHAVDRYFTFLKAFSIVQPDRDEVNFFSLFTIDHFCSNDVVRNSNVCDYYNEIQAKYPVVLIHPYSRGENKNIPPRVIEEIISELVKTGIVVIIVGRKPKKYKINSLYEFKDSIDFSDKTNLIELFYLMYKANFILSSDSGPLHLATALNQNVLSFHSWTNPSLVGPYLKKCWIYKQGVLAQVDDIPEYIQYEDREFKINSLEDIQSQDIKEICSIIDNKINKGLTKQ